MGGMERRRRGKERILKGEERRGGEERRSGEGRGGDEGRGDERREKERWKGGREGVVRRGEKERWRRGRDGEEEEEEVERRIGGIRLSHLPDY